MKYMKKIALALVIGCTSMGLTSCSEEGGLIDTIINVIGGIFNQDETYTYNIEVSKAKIMTNITNAESIAWSDTTEFRGQTVQLVANTNGATLSLPDYNWQMAQIKGLTIYNLDITANGDFSDLSINAEKSSIDGTFTFNGETYTAFYAELSTAIVSQTDILLSGIFQFAKTDAEGNVDDSNVQQLEIIQLMKSTTPVQ